MKNVTKSATKEASKTVQKDSTKQAAKETMKTAKKSTADLGGMNPWIKRDPVRFGDGKPKGKKPTSEASLKGM